MVEGTHFVLGTSLLPPFTAGSRTIILGMGCFWAAERRFWGQQGVLCTHVGYSGGDTHNPRHSQINHSGHTEVVRVVYDPAVVSLERILHLFWNIHPAFERRTQNKYRSCVIVNTDEEKEVALQVKSVYERKFGTTIYTDIEHKKNFYYADSAHQQYYAKHN